MRFRTRAFLVCFIPFALLLAAGFWSIQRYVQTTVREGLRSSLSQNQRAIAAVYAKADLQNSRFLRVVGENAALKGGMQLLVSERGSEAARLTVEDQLRELGEHMGFDFLLVSAPNGTALAGVVRKTVGDSSQLIPVDVAKLESSRKGVLLIEDHAVQVASVAVDQGEENLGTLSVGKDFDFSEFTTPAVLIHNGSVIQSNMPNVPLTELRSALQSCGGEGQCELRLRGANWISLPMRSESVGSGYLLRSLVNVDAAIAPVQSVLHNMFLGVALASVLVALLCSLISSRSIERPIEALVSHLRRSSETGVLPEFETRLSSIMEIRELVENYNRAAVSVREARYTLQAAYVEFVGSLANALDARDHYTAGHSRRVSQLSCATAEALGLSEEKIEQIRVGALLHDIGKIGVADSVLQKAGRLTDEEFALVKEHPVIGRRILEGVQGLQPFLAAVELHHENWDGTGYPRGQAREQTPVEARIIHVADAYDAMTTNRSYRQGLTHERAIEILCEYAGTQFDPAIVEIFRQLPRTILTGRSRQPEELAHAAEFEVWEAV